MVLFDSDYWAELMEWMHKEMLEDDLISPEDIDLPFLTDDTKEIIELIVSRYKIRLGEWLGLTLEDALVAARQETDPVPAVGVVLGSGLGGLADAVEDGVEIPYDRIPGWPVSTAVGQCGRARGRHSGRSACCSHAGPGASLRRVRCRPRSRWRARARPARRKDTVATNAAGAIDESYRPGMLVPVLDHVNPWGHRLSSGRTTRPGPRFPDMASVRPRAG